MELNKCESRVLHILRSFGEDYGLNFGGIASELRERHKEEWGKTNIRNACRSLKEKGLASFRQTLWDEDEGRPVGAGYVVTNAGMKLDMAKEKSQ